MTAKLLKLWLFQKKFFIALHYILHDEKYDSTFQPPFLPHPITNIVLGIHLKIVIFIFFVQVIGDKKAAHASVILLKRKGRESVKKLESELGVKLKFIHVIRNPFDNIATLALRAARVKTNSAQDNLKVTSDVHLCL